MLKSVNFFIFNFQNLNIETPHDPLLAGRLRGTIVQNRQICQMFTSV